jgi:di/tricarboxylate transporter
MPMGILYLQLQLPQYRRSLNNIDYFKEVMGSLFSGTVLVAMGAFTMSIALSKYNLSYRLVVYMIYSN